MPLTLTFKQQDLHPVQRERLSEAVSHGVLLFLENLGNLKSCEDKCFEEERIEGEEESRAEERRGHLPLGGH